MNLRNELNKTLQNIKKIMFEENYERVYSYNEIKISDKDIDGKAELINEDGSLSPLPDGEYKMEDGFHFTVKDGVIVSLIVDEDEQLEDENKPAETTDETDNTTDEKVNELEEKIDSIEEKVDELIKSNNEEKEENLRSLKAINETIEQFKLHIQKLTKQPVVETKTNEKVIAKKSMNSVASLFSKK